MAAKPELLSPGLAAALSMPGQCSPCIIYAVLGNIVRLCPRVNNDYDLVLQGKGGRCLKTRQIQHLPVFLISRAEVVAMVRKAVIGDDFRLLYLVVKGEDGQEGLIFSEDLELTSEAVKIRDLNCIKSYAYGEELSVYKEKLGDSVFDQQGKELGIVSDFILSPTEKQVQGLEISSGVIGDMLKGRMELPLQEISWKGFNSGILAGEGSQEE